MAVVVGHDADVSVADDYLAGLDPVSDGWNREDAGEFIAAVADDPAWLREEKLLRCATRPVMAAVIRFAVDQWPGQDASQDATWEADAAFARRELEVHRHAGIAPEMTDLALGLLDWIAERTGRWEDRDFGALVRAQVDELLEARRRGHERGQMLRQHRGHLPSLVCSACWALRHPADHYFRQAQVMVADDRLRELLAAQIARLSRAYQRLSAADQPHAGADVVAELEVRGPVGHGWREPIATTVLTSSSSDIAAGDQLGLRLVADPDAPFNGTLVSVGAGERWIVCADRIENDMILPLDGTRRLSA